MTSPKEMDAFQAWYTYCQIPFPPKGLCHFTLPPALLLIRVYRLGKLEHIQSVNHAAQGLDHWTVGPQGKTGNKRQRAQAIGNDYTENT